MLSKPHGAGLEEEQKIECISSMFKKAVVPGEVLIRCAALSQHVADFRLLKASVANFPGMWASTCGPDRLCTHNEGNWVASDWLQPEL